MKKQFLLANILTFMTLAIAHGDKEGPHHQEETLLGSTDPVALTFTLGMTSLGVILLGVSVWKYRKDA